ncbi:hypothetical protein ACYPKM_02875 [Pseudomonas aeruginosa]
MRKSASWGVALAASLGAGNAFAVSSGGVDIAANFATLFEISSMIAVFIGVMLVASGLYGFYLHGKGDQGVTVAGSVTRLLVGTLLVSVGWAYELFKGSFIGQNDNGVSITDSGQYSLALDQAALAAATQIGTTGYGKYLPASTLKAIFAFVFFVGFIAVISGVYSLKDIGGNSRAERPILMPTVKILGGVICMNFTWFGCLIGDFIGMSMLCIE